MFKKKKLCRRKGMEMGAHKKWSTTRTTWIMDD